MKPKDVVIGFIFLVILVLGALLVFKYKDQKSTVKVNPTPNIVSKIDTSFAGLNIPPGAERAELKDLTGGGSVGVATRTEIVANLPSLKSGEDYKVWLSNKEGKTVFIGKLKMSKSGWLLIYDSKKYSGYNKVIVTKGTTNLLEGSF